MRTITTLLALALLGGCAAPADDTSTQGAAVVSGKRAEDVAIAADDPALGFTDDFRKFLAADHAAHDFARADLSGGSAYGGRLEGSDAVKRDPIVFVHGNSDRGIGGTYDGWDETITYARAHGYGPQELYAFTWGDANLLLVSQQYHSRKNVERVRAFLKVVLAYTGAEKIDVIAHSMGVTLARKAILGGEASDALGGGSYDLGPSLGTRVDAFLGISAGNLGLSSCWAGGPTTPTCGATNGFYPGTRVGFGPVVGRSAFLDDLLDRRGEASWVASMYAPTDEFLGPDALVWGENTARIPGEDTTLRLATGCTHFRSKSRTAAAQIALVDTHDPTRAPRSCD